MSFQEVPLKYPACRPIPQILLPYLPSSTLVGSPAWLSPTPRICRLKRGDCISLDDVLWRNRKGYHRLTPRGFPNDGMSYGAIIRAVTGWDNYDPETLRSGITHDCPYSMYDHLCHWPLTRDEVDVDILDGLRAEIDKFAWIKYRAVRRVGWIPWHIKTQDPLVEQWIDRLHEGPEALDAWIAYIVKTKAA